MGACPFISGQLWVSPRCFHLWQAHRQAAWTIYIPSWSQVNNRYPGTHLFLRFLQCKLIFHISVTLAKLSCNIGTAKKKKILIASVTFYTSYFFCFHWINAKEIIFKRFGLMFWEKMWITKFTWTKEKNQFSENTEGDRPTCSLRW